jgi:hypothetical protein
MVLNFMMLNTEFLKPPRGCKKNGLFLFNKYKIKAINKITGDSNTTPINDAIISKGLFKYLVYMLT